MSSVGLWVVGINRQEVIDPFKVQRVKEGWELGYIVLKGS